MRKLSFLLMVSLILVLLMAGCAAEFEGNMPMEQGYGNGLTDQPQPGGMGLQYERGREDYPGQSYASLIGATVPKGSGGGSGLELRSIRTPVRQGETGGISIQGRPDTQYTITAVYNNSGNMVTSTAVKRSGENGMVELEWNVSSQTEPGTYGVMVSGGGEQITAAYTVTE